MYIHSYDNAEGVMVFDSLLIQDCLVNLYKPPWTVFYTLKQQKELMVHCSTVLSGTK
jgi:hypothetical protein